MEEKRKQIIEITRKLLDEKGLDSGSDPHGIEVLAGDGSQRQFYRLQFDNGLSMVAILPSADQKQGMEEAYSSWSIGNHLYSKGIPVPELISFDSQTGLILTEDLGDVRLHEYVCERKKKDRADTYQTYRKVVQELVKMQVLGSRNFDGAWCWQTRRYDRQLMLERESGYFVDAFCNKFLNIHTEIPALQAEFKNIADQAAGAPADFFLHRDFQSRNIMIKDGKIQFIDYQGGRFGPLGYDLASLLIDPYVGLKKEFQEDLLAFYIAELENYINFDPEKFRWEYVHLAVQRNLQILGAFAFLGKQRGKDFFLPFIPPALFSLQDLLNDISSSAYPTLTGMIELCLQKIGEHAI